MSDDNGLLITLSAEDRQTIYLACGLLMSTKGIKREAKETAMNFLRRLQDEEEKHGL
jgi:hypothetical protein